MIKQWVNSAQLHMEHCPTNKRQLVQVDCCQKTTEWRTEKGEGRVYWLYTRVFNILKTDVATLHPLPQISCRPRNHLCLQRHSPPCCPPLVLSDSLLCGRCQAAPILAPVVFFFPFPIDLCCLCRLCCHFPVAAALLPSALSLPPPYMMARVKTLES